jgi:hypothetical protein
MFDYRCRVAINCETRALCAMQQSLTFWRTELLYVSHHWEKRINTGLDTSGRGVPAGAIRGHQTTSGHHR